ncbi:MAG: DUF4468 domain-containing protein [Mucilaginibacter sp.]
MKKILAFVACLMAATYCFGQDIVPPIDSATHKITYTGVIASTGNKDQLYDRALNWFAITFKSANDVIQIKDKENGKIVGDWYIQPVEPELGYVSSNISVWVKDGKYKFEITNLSYQGTSEQSAWRLEDNPGVWKVNMFKNKQKQIKRHSYLIIQQTIASLKSAMNTTEKDF